MDRGGPDETEMSTDPASAVAGAYAMLEDCQSELAGVHQPLKAERTGALPERAVRRRTQWVGNAVRGLLGTTGPNEAVPWRQTRPQR